MNQEAWGPQEEYYTPRARAKASLIHGMFEVYKFTTSSTLTNNLYRDST